MTEPSSAADQNDAPRGPTLQTLHYSQYPPPWDADERVCWVDASKNPPVFKRWDGFGWHPIADISEYPGYSLVILQPMVRGLAEGFEWCAQLVGGYPDIIKRLESAMLDDLREKGNGYVDDSESAASEVRIRAAQFYCRNITKIIRHHMKHNGLDVPNSTKASIALHIINAAEQTQRYEDDDADNQD